MDPKQDRPALADLLADMEATTNAVTERARMLMEEAESLGEQDAAGAVEGGDDGAVC